MPIPFLGIYISVREIQYMSVLVLDVTQRSGMSAGAEYNQWDDTVPQNG